MALLAGFMHSLQKADLGLDAAIILTDQVACGTAAARIRLLELVFLHSLFPVSVFHILIMNIHSLKGSR